MLITWISTSGAPTTITNAFALVMATLNLLGLSSRPRLMVLVSSKAEGDKEGSLLLLLLSAEATDGDESEDGDTVAVDGEVNEGELKWCMRAALSTKFLRAKTVDTMTTLCSRP